jgi:hypothetical protein
MSIPEVMQQAIGVQQEYDRMPMEPWRIRRSLGLPDRPGGPMPTTMPFGGGYEGWAAGMAMASPAQVTGQGDWGAQPGFYRPFVQPALPLAGQSPVVQQLRNPAGAYTVAALGSSCLVAARLDSMLTVSIAQPAWEGQSRLAKAVLECVILAVSAPCLTQASRPHPSLPRGGCLLPARLTSTPLARTAGTGPACTAQGWSANGNIIREDRR